MILPSKHISPERSLIGVGSRLLPLLDHPQTISTAWERFEAVDRARSGAAAVTFDWFVLCLDMLYAMGSVEICDGLLVRVPR